MAPLGVAPSERALGHRRRCDRVPHRPLAGQRHRQRLHTGSEHRPERRCHRARPVVRGGGMDGRNRRARTTRWPRSSGTSSPPTSRAELGALLPHDRRPQGRRDAVRRRRPVVPVHRWAPGHAHPHGVAQPDEPRLRTGHLHRHRRRARHDHDDDGLLGGGRTPGELADPPHDRLAAHGLSPCRGLLVLDLHGRLSGHRERALLRRVPDRVDRLRAAADPGGGGDGLLSGGLRGHRDRHDHGRLQPGRHHHQLPGARHDLGPAADLRLEHPGHHRPPHAGHTDAGGVVSARNPRPHRRRPPSS